MVKQYKDNNNPNVAYMVWDKWVQTMGTRCYRVYYKATGHPVRVMPGTAWRRTEKEARKDLSDLAKYFKWEAI